MAKADWMIVTAAGPAQAAGYRHQLKARAEELAALGVEHAEVVADPGGHRVGSGGSTLWVLHQVARQLAKDRPDAKSIADLFRGRRVLIIHSGGDARRLCAYSAHGKAFVPLPCGRSLFDLILANLIALPCPPAGQVLIAAGDVLLTFEPDHVDFDRPGVVGVGYPAPIERGSKHGVYVVDPAQGDRVTDFLQKPTQAEARQRGALDAVGRVIVDTGLISLDPPTVDRWLTMAGASLGKRGDVTTGRGLLRDLSGEGTSVPNIDLYEQMLMAVPKRMTAKRYLAAMADSKTRQQDDAAHTPRLQRIHAALHGQAFHVSVLPYCDFFHIGSSRELLANVTTLGRTAQTYGFANFDRAVVRDRSATEGAFIYNSVVDTPRFLAGGHVLVEGSHLTGSTKLPGHNLVVGYPGQVTARLALAQGQGIVCNPVKAPGSTKDGWAAVLFGLDDDFKTAASAGGTFCNRPLDELADRSGLTARQMWGGVPVGERTLWDARLWVVDDAEAAVTAALALGRLMAGGRRPAGDEPTLARWRQAKRYSVRQLLGRVDHDRLIGHRRELERLVGIARLGERLADEPMLPAESVVALLRDADDAKHALAQVDQQIEATAAPLDHARLHRVRAAIAQAQPAAAGKRFAGQATRSAFDAVAESVRAEIDLPPQPPRAGILTDQVVWATTPVRIDFAGGWSDTPPICTEQGGAVINAAVTLNGQYPVQVMAKLSDTPAITLSSIDLGQRVVIETSRQLAGAIDATQWHALPVAALRLAGLLPAKPDASLKRHLERFGGGLDITLFSALPKGSGMGTSSILGAAMLACLARVTGQPLDQDAVIARTSLLEQIMGTGGGWQDQVGGITPGIKLIRTRPGPDQSPSIHWCAADTPAVAGLDDRALLYFTGIKRMARDILQKVVLRYLARDPGLMQIVDELKTEAEHLKRHLDAGDADALSRGVERYWQLKRAIDPGSTNPRIEALLEPVNRYLDARLLPGAGGGGFVFMIAKDPDAAATVRRVLSQAPPNPLSRLFDFRIDRQGLQVTTH